MCKERVFVVTKCIAFQFKLACTVRKNLILVSQDALSKISK